MRQRWTPVDWRTLDPELDELLNAGVPREDGQAEETWLVEFEGGR